MKTRVFHLVVWVATTSLLGGCMLLGLHEDLEEYGRYGSVSGVIKSNSPHKKPIQVVLVKINEKDLTDNTIINWAVMYEPGPYKFWALPGTYMVGAFEDTDENLAFHPHDYVGWYGAPDTIAVEKGSENEGMHILLRPPGEARNEFPLLYELPPFKVSELLEKEFSIGEVVKLRDSRFGSENGEMGYWKPMRFMYEVGGGIFFLQEYDPQKIPVLFVHGAEGNPVEFEQIIKRMDQRRFQAWVLSYPSGMRLGDLSRWVSRGILSLQLQYGFRVMYVLAHSMGGLVARGFINRLIESNDDRVIRLFISMSTPWGGQAMAAKGAKQCPVVVPAWYDMASGSPYIKRLFKTPLPSHLEYDLLFSYQGGWHLTIPRNNDGTVSLQSELFMPAQLAARKIYGFNVNHDGILTNPEVIEMVNLLMEERSKR